MEKQTNKVKIENLNRLTSLREAKRRSNLKNVNKLGGLLRQDYVLPRNDVE